MAGLSATYDSRLIPGVADDGPALIPMCGARDDPGQLIGRLKRWKSLPVIVSGQPKSRGIIYEGGVADFLYKALGDDCYIGAVRRPGAADHVNQELAGRPFITCGDTIAREREGSTSGRREGQKSLPSTLASARGRVAVYMRPCQLI